MSQARWQQLQEVFEGLLERDPSERADWLATLDVDASIKNEALALAEGEEQAHDRVRDHLQAVAARSATAPADRRLGAW